MKVQCPKCSATSDVPDSPGPSGGRIDCPSCGESFQPSLARQRSGWGGSTAFWVALVAVIGVLVAVAAFALMKAGARKLEGVLEAGQVARVRADLETLQVGLTIYRVSAGDYPSDEQGLDALVERPTTGKLPRSWQQVLEEPLVDPWGYPYGYRYPATKNKDFPDVLSLGPDGFADTEDDIGNWE